MQPSPPVTERALSPRMQEVVMLLAQGLTMRQIAERLNVSHNTARMYAMRSYERLGVRSRTEAVVKAIRLGLLQV